MVFIDEALKLLRELNVQGSSTQYTNLILEFLEIFTCV